MVEHLHPTCYHLDEMQPMPFVDIGFQAHQCAHCHHNTLYVNGIQSTKLQKRGKQWKLQVKSPFLEKK